MPLAWSVVPSSSCVCTRIVASACCSPHVSLASSCTSLEPMQEVRNCLRSILSHVRRCHVQASDRRFCHMSIHGAVAQMVERSLCMREVQGSIPCSSNPDRNGSPLSFFLFDGDGVPFRRDGSVLRLEENENPHVRRERTLLEANSTSDVWRDKGKRMHMWVRS